MILIIITITYFITGKVQGEQEFSLLPSLKEHFTNDNIIIWYCILYILFCMIFVVYMYIKLYLFTCNIIMILFLNICLIFSWYSDFVMSSGGGLVQGTGLSRDQSPSLYPALTIEISSHGPPPVDPPGSRPSPR